MDRKFFIASLTAILLIVFSLPVLAEEDSKKKEWQVGTELSYTDSSGNSESQTLAGKIGIKKEEELNRYYFNGTVIKTESENEETANRWGVDGSYERTLGDGFFGSGEADYLKDKFSGYKYRYGG
ncbi:MAG: DUF481 domain-containing protein, partial [Syntrophales bacterium]|nr:DUF481 domain-containing protein [Syntrophales bacterium]